MTNASTTSTTKVLFICWGNICRSPMAERIARDRAEQAGLEIEIEITSAATSREELGAPIDPRAARWLDDHGYDSSGHVAHQVDAEELAAADLVVVMEDLHLRRMSHLADVSAPKFRLLSDFDPDAEPGSGLADPWYGGEDGFDDTGRAIEAAMPGLLSAVGELR